MRRLILLIVLGVVAIGGYLAYRGYSSHASTYKVAAAIRRQLHVPGGLHIRSHRSRADRFTAMAQRFYLWRAGWPAWTDAKGPLPRATRLVDRLAGCTSEGLDPSQYRVDELRQRLAALENRPLASPEPAPADVAAADVALTRAFLRYASHLSVGRILPEDIPQWHTHPRCIDPVAALRQAVKGNDLDGVLGSLEPSQEQYGDLKVALGHYLDVARRGGWQPVPAGGVIHPGQRGPRVAALRARLAATGDLPSGAEAAASSDTYDGSVEQAVQHFQQRLGMTQTGTVGAGELSELNVPVEDRIRQIQLNLERWRWTSGDLGGDYIRVNIPEYALYVVEGGRPVMTMRVVVGKEFTPTPIFDDRVSYIVFNPTWNIPRSIVVNEIIPAMQKDPGYLAQKHIQALNGADEKGAPVDPASIDWSDSDRAAQYSFRQDSGDENALGRMKFMCPNEFDIYLHDTPAQQLFGREDRAFSHGCIRLERPMQLAQYLLRDNPGWDQNRINQVIGQGQTETVPLKRGEPLHILYWTAWADPDGTLHLRDDVYGLDEMLDRKLPPVNAPTPQATRPIAALARHR